MKEEKPTIFHIERAHPRGVVFTPDPIYHDMVKTWWNTVTRMMEVGFLGKPLCFITPAETASTRDLDWDEMIPVCETYTIGGYPYLCAFDPRVESAVLKEVAKSQDLYLGPVWMAPLTQLDKDRLFGLVEAMLKAGLFDWPQTDEEILYSDPDGEVVYWLNPSIGEEAILEELARLAKEANWRVESEFAGR